MKHGTCFLNYKFSFQILSNFQTNDVISLNLPNIVSLALEKNWGRKSLEIEW